MAFDTKFAPLKEGESGPLYIRLQKQIREAIQSGDLPGGGALPSERDLCAKYDLSRVTIRKALDGLVDEGLLERRQGAGTFVSEHNAPEVSRRVEKSLTKISSFSEDMVARGRKPHSEWLDRSQGPASPEEVMALNLSLGTPVMRFHRIRYADDKSMALEWAIVPAWALGSPMQVTESLYDALDTAGNRPVRALQRIRATRFSAEHAALLGIEENDPCLFIERRAYLADGRAVEVTYCYYRGDAYDLVAELGES